MLTRISSFLITEPRPAAPSIDLRLLGPRVVLRAGEPEDWRNWRAMREM